MANYFWYALRVRGGKEEKIKQAIEATFDDKGYTSSLKKIHIPFQRAYRVQNNQRTIKKDYFAYFLIQVDLSNEEVKDCLMHINGVMGFVTPTGFGRNREPIPLHQVEVDNMLGEVDSSASLKPNLNDTIQKGDHVDILHGPFQGHQAIVQTTNEHSKKVEVSVRIFKKDTKLELYYNQLKRRNP